jgi:general secretion pathway protein A
MSLNLAFFGLEQTPFNPTPNPRFLYLSPGHREGLAQLLYGVQEHKGFILLTGDIGTGKTTLLRTLLSRLDGNTASAFVFDTTLPFEGLLEYILEDFGIAKPGESHVQRLIALNNFLIERRRAGQNTVLILDEAQNLDLHALEQIRLLSNFETETEKLLQILLVGQPELLDKLDRPELRQLKQRIGLRCRILPLTADQTRDYIRTRLRIAGASDLGLFSDAAITRIAEYSGGIPRLINTLCDHCLMIGYADQIRRISRSIVEETIEYFEQGERRPRKPRRLLHTWRRMLVRWGLPAAGAVLLGGIATLTIAHRSALQPVLDVSAATLSGLAHAASSFLRQ